MTRQDLENRIHRKLIAHGWFVKRIEPAAGGWLPGRTYWTPEYIQRLGFRPATVIDVGVGYGTPNLYAAFPDAHLLLVEPVVEFNAAIQTILASRKGTHASVALGREPGTCEFQVELEDLQTSSLFARGPLEATDKTKATRQVPADSLDRVLAKHACPRPYGIKIDAEGAELEVLAGATETLRHTEFVIAEVAVPPRFENGYHFAQLIAEMDRAGFHVCDILDIGRADTTELTFLDLVFRPQSR